MTISRRHACHGLALVMSTVVLKAQAEPDGGLVPFSRPIDAPPIQLQRLSDGQTTTVHFSGGPTLVAFFASWCQPCQAEMPALLRLQADMVPLGCSLVCIASGESATKAGAFADRYGVRGLDILVDPERIVSTAWRIGALPSAYVVGADGQLAYSALGEVDWDSSPVRERILDLKTKPMVSDRG